MNAGHIKNPLTVIAIFAGVTEVGGTFVLPHITDVFNQRIYIVFLTVFPAYLISLFFLMLWKRHTHLYAPSDYVNENNFVAASNSAVADKLHKEVLEEAAESDLSQQEAAPAPEADALTPDMQSQTDIPTSAPDVPPQPVANDESQTVVEHFDELLRKPNAAYIHRKRRPPNSHENKVALLRIATELAITRISEEFGGEFKRQVTPTDMPSLLLDAARSDANGIFAVEVKYTTGTIGRSSYQNTFDLITSYYLRLGDIESSMFRLVFVIVNDNPDRATAILNAQEIADFAKKLPYKTIVKTYTLADLIQGTSFG